MDSKPENAETAEREIIEISSYTEDDIIFVSLESEIEGSEEGDRESGAGRLEGTDSGKKLMRKPVVQIRITKIGKIWKTKVTKVGLKTRQMEIKLSDCSVESDNVFCPPHPRRGGTPDLAPTRRAWR